MLSVYNIFLQEAFSFLFEQALWNPMWILMLHHNHKQHFWYQQIWPAILIKEQTNHKSSDSLWNIKSYLLHGWIPIFDHVYFKLSCLHTCQHYWSLWFIHLLFPQLPIFHLVSDTCFEREIGLQKSICNIFGADCSWGTNSEEEKRDCIWN